MGHADLLLGDAAAMFRGAGQRTAADHLDRDVVGRNVIDGRWTFQLVEEFDDAYYDLVRQLVRTLEAELAGGRRHLYERQMKEDRRSRGMPGHERVPADVHGAA
jgi:hypothetical protein